MSQFFAVKTSLTVPGLMICSVTMSTCLLVYDVSVLLLISCLAIVVVSVVLLIATVVLSLILVVIISVIVVSVSVFWFWFVFAVCLFGEELLKRTKRPSVLLEREFEEFRLV